MLARFNPLRFFKANESVRLTDDEVVSLGFVLPRLGAIVKLAAISINKQSFDSIGSTCFDSDNKSAPHARIISPEQFLSQVQSDINAIKESRSNFHIQIIWSNLLSWDLTAMEHLPAFFKCFGSIPIRLKLELSQFHSLDAPRVEKLFTSMAAGNVKALFLALPEKQETEYTLSQVNTMLLNQYLPNVELHLCSYSDVAAIQAKYHDIKDLVLKNLRYGQFACPEDDVSDKRSMPSCSIM